MVGAWRPRWFVNRVEYSAPIQRLLRLTDRRWLGMFVLPERRECQRLVCYCYTNPQCYGTANGTRTRSGTVFKTGLFTNFNTPVFGIGCWI